jgi:hypothetical protein
LACERDFRYNPKPHQACGRAAEGAPAPQLHSPREHNHRYIPYPDRSTVCVVGLPLVGVLVIDSKADLVPRAPRPCIKVGGELSAAMLELRRDEATDVFVAPCQVKANNGILIIDDFGRQMISPR